MKKLKPRILLTAQVTQVFADLSFAEDIRDIQPPVNLPPNYFLLYMFVIILAAAVLFYLIRFLVKRFRKPKAEITAVKPSWKVAFEHLEDLKSQDLPSRGMFKEYYTLLSGIVRKYIEDRFKVKAPEMTTQEFLSHLKTSYDFSVENKKMLKYFLNSCDMVKFAKYGPTLNETEGSFDSAKNFIDETKEAQASVPGNK